MRKHFVRLSLLMSLLIVASVGTSTAGPLITIGGTFTLSLLSSSTGSDPFLYNGQRITIAAVLDGGQPGQPGPNGMEFSASGGISINAYIFDALRTPGTVTIQANPAVPGVIIFSVPGFLGGKITVYVPPGLLNPNVPTPFPSQSIDLNGSKLEVQVGNLVATYLLSGRFAAADLPSGDVPTQQGNALLSAVIQPIPEPASILMVLGGLGILGWKTWRARP